MQILDLTHTIAPEMPVYPGTEPPVLAPANTYERNGFRETLLSLFSHTGTHMDAPAHLFAHLPTLDALPVSQFCGAALALDVSFLGAGGRIGLEHLEPVRALADQADFLLFYTGWERYWGCPEYFGDYPVVTEEVVDFLLAFGKKGIGLDTIGLDPIADEGLTLHRRLLSSGKAVILENLCGFSGLTSKLFTLYALPLNYQNADGAPVRAIAVLDGSEKKD